MKTVKGVPLDELIRELEAAANEDDDEFAAACLEIIKDHRSMVKRALLITRNTSGRFSNDSRTTARRILEGFGGSSR